MIMWAMVGAAALGLAAGGASAAVIDFESGSSCELPCEDDYREAIFGDYLIQTGDFLEVGLGVTDAFGNGDPDDTYVSVLYTDLTISRVDGRSFYVDGLSGGAFSLIPEEATEPGAVRVSYEGTPFSVLFTYDQTVPFAFELGAYARPVSAIRLSHVAGEETFIFANQFEARAVAPVPLPASALLMGLGLTALVVVRRRPYAAQAT